MSAKLRPLGALLLASLLLSCGDDPGTGPKTEEEGISSTALVYLTQALNIMENYSINRYKIEWVGFRERVVEVAGDAQTKADTYDAIRFALVQLGDHHSFFRPPGGQSLEAAPLPEPFSNLEPASAKMVEEGIGYVSVSAFSGTTDQANALAASYHEMIEGVDTLGVCGWVVDLRGNLGGNMWPMIAGVGELAGEGTLGFFVDPDSIWTKWGYDDGASWSQDHPITQVPQPYHLLHPDPPVAVLTDSLTASSGEATTIAFRGRPDTRSFGGPTWGVSTANRRFDLSDGAMIYLTTSVMADRTGFLYGEKVIPDQVVGGPSTGLPSSDPPLAAAIQWLELQPACAGV